MSVTNTADESTEEELYEAECGHMATPDETHHWGEVYVCSECYFDIDRAHFGLEDWPEILQSKTVDVIEGRRASQWTSTVSLVAITTDRKAIYHDDIDGYLWTCVPKHSRDHDTSDPIKDSIRHRDIDATYGAPRQQPGDFVTLPDGDHVVCTEMEETPDSIDSWIEANRDDLRAVVWE